MGYLDEGRNIMKKIIMVFMLLVVMLFISSCGTSLDDKESSSSSVAVNTFSPTEFDKMVLWLGAQEVDGLENGERLFTWRDMSPSENNAIARNIGTGPIYITNKLNGKPILRFDNSANPYMIVSPIDVTRNWTMISVVLFPHEKYTNQHVLLSNRNNDGHYHIEELNDELGNWGFNGSDFYPSSLGDGGHILSAVVSDPYLTYYANSIKRGRSSIGVDSPIEIVGGPAPWGDVGEIILYDSVLSDDERLAIEQYLARKWGISL